MDHMKDFFNDQLIVGAVYGQILYLKEHIAQKKAIYMSYKIRTERPSSADESLRRKEQ